MFIVSDEVLERLICSHCKKYLSVKPVKVYPNRGIKCGRCSNPFDAGVTSLFGVLADEALFRCVNRFDGCNKLLMCTEIKMHEVSCTGKMHECPNCITPFQGSGYNMYMHFKTEHSNRILLGASEFVLNLNNDQYKSYLYRKDDLLFFINTSYYSSDNEVILSILYLGPANSQIYQMFTLLSVDEKVLHKTRKKTCSSVGEKNLNYFKIVLNKNDLLRNVVICKFELNTEDIANILVLPDGLKRTLTTTETTCSFPFDFAAKIGLKNYDFNTIKKTFSEETKNQNNGLAISDNNPIFKPFIWEIDHNTKQYDKPSGTLKKFHLVTLSENDNFSKSVNKCYLQSISTMTRYKNWSFEELRLADYEANRKGQKCLDNKIFNNNEKPMQNMINKRSSVLSSK